MWQFVDEHFEGIIALCLGGLIPIIIYGFKIYKEDILNRAEEQLNGVTKRFDLELNLIREKLVITRESIIHLQDKNSYQNNDLKEQLEHIEKELEQLDLVKQELQGTRELMLLQHNNLKQQIEDFKQFCKEILLK